MHFPKRHVCVLLSPPRGRAGEGCTLLQECPGLHISGCDRWVPGPGTQQQLCSGPHPPACLMPDKVIELVLASSSVWRAQLSESLLTTGHCYWQALGCLPAVEPGVCLHSPTRLEHRAAVPAGPTGPPWHDGYPRKQEALLTLSSCSHLFPQLCPAEDRLGARLHRDFDAEWQIQQPATSCPNCPSSGSELQRQRQRHACTLRHSGPLSSPTSIPFGSSLPTS